MVGDPFLVQNTLKNLIFILDRLLTEPLPNKDPRVLPSPEDLKFKVLIRVRRKTFALIDVCRVDDLE